MFLVDLFVCRVVLCDKWTLQSSATALIRYLLQARRGSQINVNVAPTVIDNDTPEIRKYKKRFNSDILCAALWGEL